MSFFKRLVDGTDRTVNAPAVLACVLVLAFIAYQGYALYANKPFDPMGFAGGAAAIIAAIASARWFDRGKDDQS